MFPRSSRVALVLVPLAIFLMAAPAWASNAIQLENARPGNPEWQLSLASPNGQIEGYASATSLNRGESISFYVSTVDPTYAIAIYRMGWYGGAGARLMQSPVTRTGIRQTIPSPDPSTGIVECNWTDPYVLTIPSSSDPTEWCSGTYLAKLTGSSGRESYISFVVRDDARISNHYFQSSVTTYQAYNNWGGKSLYSFNSCSTWRTSCAAAGTAAVKVSFNRPYASGDGTGDFLWSWEYNMVRFLEREGFDVTYCTNIDTARRGSLLLNHKDFLSIGHDEYWSYDMRQSVESARSAGVNLAFFGANVCYWQIRFEPGSGGVADRTIVGYKEKATTQDPFATDKTSTNDYLVTTNWRSSPVNNPESALVGVMYSYSETNMAKDIVLDNTTAVPWIFSGTGATSGTHLTGLLGYEVDAIGTGSPAGLTRLAHSPFTNVNTGATQYSDMTLYTAPSGAVVFGAGTIQWAWGLDDWNLNAHSRTPVSDVATKMTRNILLTYAGSAAIRDCRYAISPASASVSTAPGSGSVNVASGTSCPWSPSTSAPWLTITAGASGSGNGMLSYSYTQNTGAARSARLTIGDQTFTLTQAGCSYSLSPTSQSFSAPGGNDTVAVTATSGCPWTATASQPWVTITSGSNGAGNGTVAYSVAANTGQARNAVLTIAGSTVAITQSNGCSYSVSPPSASYGAAASNGAVTLNASGADCPWTASSGAAWVNLTTPSSGTGSTTVRYNVSANIGAPRDTTLTVAGNPVAIHQAGGCTFTLSPTAASFSASAGQGSVTVTASSTDCAWTSSSSVSWLTISSGSSGTGSGTVTYAVGANSGPPRDDILTIGGVSFAVHQSDGCAFAVSPTSANVAASGGQGSVTLSASSQNCVWIAKSSATWVAITPVNGTGNAALNYSVEANSGAARDAVVTINGATFAIHQASCTFTVAPASASYSAGAGQGTITLTASSASCPWSATSNSAWVTFSGATSGAGSGTLTYNVAANPGSARDAVLMVGGNSVAIHQASGCTFSVSPTSVNAAAAASQGTIALTVSDATCAWTSSSSAAWLTIVGPGSGSGGATVTYSVAANSGAARDGVITLGGQSVAVHQDSGCTYSLNPTVDNFPATSGSGTVTVTTSGADCPWTATPSASWVTISGASSGAGSGTVSYTVASNSGPARDGALTIAGSVLTIHQSGGCSVTLSPATADIPKSGGQGTITVTTTSSTCQWSATSSAAWVTFPSSASGTGNGSVTYDVAANGGNVRDAIVTIAGQDVTIHQASGCTYTSTPTSFSFAEGAANGSVSVTTDATCYWSSSSSFNWITLTAGDQGKGPGATSFTVAANTTGSPRRGYIIVAGTTIVINQGSVAPRTPSSVVATATTPSQILVSWAAVPAVTWYEVYRQSAGGAVTLAGTSTTTSFTDNSVASNRAYIYRVRATNGSGSSPDSAPDLATTIMFTDDPPVPRSTIIKAVHVTELRAAVDAVRTLAGLSPASFTDAIVSGMTVKAIHIAELRTRLDEALVALGLPAGGYSSGAIVRAVHFQEIRSRLK